MEKLRLGNICEKIGSGATPRGGSEVYLTDGVALIRSQNVHNDGFKKDGLAFITDAHAEELLHVMVHPDDILLNITGDSVARVCQVPKEVLPARVNQHVAIIRPRKNIIDPRFLRFFLVSPAMQELMLSLSHAGATRKALTKGMIEDFLIPAPPLPYQKAIAHILGMLDDKIELNRRMNETLEAMARALFKSWFVDFDPVRAKAEGRQLEGLDADTAALFPDSLKDSAMGEIPHGWRLGSLGEISENLRLGVDPSSLSAETPYIGLEHMPRRDIALSEWGLSDGLASNKYRFSRGDILFGKLRPYFHKVGVAPVDGVCSTDILVITPKDDWFSFVLCHVSSDELIQYVDAASTGTKMPRTNWQDISRYEVIMPSPAIAKVFNIKAKDFIDTIPLKIHESRTLAAIRDALLPKLMSGEIRIKDAEKFLEKQI